MCYEKGKIKICHAVLWILTCYFRCFNLPNIVRSCSEMKYVLYSSFIINMHCTWEVETCSSGVVCRCQSCWVWLSSTVTEFSWWIRIILDLQVYKQEQKLACKWLLIEQERIYLFLLDMLSNERSRYTFGQTVLIINLSFHMMQPIFYELMVCFNQIWQLPGMY